MKNFEIPYVEDANRPDIYEMIKTKNQSPQTVIDYIKDHQMMHFGTTDLSETFNFIILFCFFTDQARLAKYIFDEFKDEIEISWLVFKLMEYKIDTVEIDYYFNEYDKNIKPNLKMSPNSIFISAFREYKENNNIEYFEMVTNGKNFMQIIKDDFLPKMFTGFQRKMFIQPIAVELLKKLIEYDSEFHEILFKSVSNDIDVLELFFPQASEMFIF